MKYCRHILIVFFLTNSLISYAQVCDKTYNYSSPFYIDFSAEPAFYLKNVSSFYYKSNPTSEIVFYNKSNGQIAGKICGYSDNLLTGSTYKNDTLITTRGDTLKLIPDNFYYFSSNKYYNQELPFRGFVIPNQYNDSIYHYIFAIDSGINKKDTLYKMAQLYRVDFYISKQRCAVLDKTPIKLGLVPTISRFLINVPFQNYTIRISNNNSGFYLYTFNKIEQKVYYCDLKNIKLIQTIDKPLNGDTQQFYFNEYNYTFYPAYFRNTAHIFSTIDTGSQILNKKYSVAIILDAATHLISTCLLSDSVINSQQNYNYASNLFSENGRYAYRLEKYLSSNNSKKSLIIVLKKFSLSATQISEDTLIYLMNYDTNKTASEIETKYRLLYEPDGRIFCYLDSSVCLTISKPDLPFGWEKFYYNFPLLDAESIKKYLYNYEETLRINEYPLKYNPKLNTKEYFNCSEVTLYVDADTLYKKFWWYLWNQQKQQFDSSEGNSFTIKDVGQGIYYKLKGMFDNGFTVWYSDSLYPQEKAVAKFSVRQEIHCQYQIVDFFDSSFSKKHHPLVPTSWHWFFGDGTDTIIYANNNFSQLGQGSVSHKYYQSGKYQVRLIYYNGLCSDTFEMPQPIYIAPAPQAGMEINPANSCVPQRFDVEPLHHDTITSERYDIYNNGRHDSTVFTPLPQGFPRGFSLMQKDSGLWYVRQTLTGPSGCVTTDSVAMVLNTFPKYTLTADTFMCAGEELLLSVSPGCSKYIWDTGDTLSQISVLHGGNYKVHIYNGNCMVIDSVQVTQNMNDDCKLSLTVYPNPFGDVLRVKSYARHPQYINLVLFDTRGRQVQAYSGVPINQFGVYEIPTADLPAALYLMRIETEQKKFIYKLVRLED